jgi:threonine aldolase
MEYIDLRSDTVTQPTPQMREAMATAAVGDDVYGEDPTINRLQELAAEMMGMEAGLFVPSGTMGNLTALLSHCQRGDELIVGNKNHIFLHEAGGASALGGIHSRQLANQADGSLDLKEIAGAIRWDDPHEPRTRLICLENTHNACGGVFQTPAYIQKVAEFAHERSIAVHLDGARIFNAAAAQGIPARNLASPADSVSFCLSKGLCAPVGSVLCGSKAFIARGLRWRKMLGGGMRQAGILAAAGLVALETMTMRLKDDHSRAKRLAEGLQGVNGIDLVTDSPATNMVFFWLRPEAPFTTAEFVNKMKDCGVLVDAEEERYFRLVTHFYIDDAAVQRTVSAFQDVLR